MGLSTPVISPAWLDQPPEAEQGDHSLDIVGQNVQRHLATDVLKPARQEMCAAHPSLHRAELVFDGAAA